jgi:3-oxoacyl-[acyl-carrier protein] reductase
MRDNHLRLAGRVAVITGAATGIGFAIARHFVREGADVMMSDVQTDACQEAATNLSKDHNLQAILHQQADVRSTASLVSLARRTIDAFGKIDVLVNNAAVAISGNAADMTDENWNEVINTNLTGVFRGIRAVLPQMIEQRSGSIINLSSTQAYRSWWNWTAYAAAKGGVLSMTRQLAGQFAVYNIRVNAISPGAILTPMNAMRVAAEGEELTARLNEMHAMNRQGLPEEIADAALYLASDESSFVTGHDLVVDGGLCTLARYRELNADES